jgi:Domain of unknown function (DUF222)/HNH endonuclease
MSDTLVRVDVSAALAEAHAAVDALQAADLTRCADAELLEFLRELERLRRRLPAVEHALVLEAESRGLPAELHAKDTAQFLRALLRLDPYEAAGRVRAAEALGARRTPTGAPLPPAYPRLAQAQAAGQISERHVRLITDTIDKLPDQPRLEQGAVIEAELVEHAQIFDPAQLSRLTRRLCDCLDPDGILRDVAYRDRLRGLHLHVRPDGSARLDGELTAEHTERLLVTFDALAGPRPQSNGVKDQRSAAQRRHDALLDALELLQRAEALPNTGGIAATVVLTIDAEAYATGTGLATTAHGALVPASATTAWGGGDTRLMAVVLDKVRGITAYSSRHRIFTRQQRLAIAARDGGCTFPGCSAPPGWSQIHHIIDYADGGPTTVDNGVMACRYDHRERIRQGWKAVIIDGRAGWIPPRWIDPAQQPRYNTMHRAPAA